MKRKSVTAWLKAFIPRKISNETVLGILAGAAKIEAGIKRMSFPIPVSRKSAAVIEKHKVQNMKILLNGSPENNGTAIYAENAYIENQNVWQEVKFGISDMRYSGCEIIAVYNALKALGEPVSERTVVDLIALYEQNGAVLGGKFGTSPYAVEEYFKRNGYDVIMTTGREPSEINRIGERCDTVIVNAYNNRNDITAMIHTVSITREKEGTYSVHNAYYIDNKKTGNDKYASKDGYGTLQEAIDAISKYAPLSIAVIGISNTRINNPGGGVPCSSRLTSSGNVSKIKISKKSRPERIFYAQKEGVTMTSQKDWIKDLVIYQIYPRSFYDANGDGIGDLPGVLQKLDYLEELGVNAIWLSPVYRSPNDDNGYDISGYQEIMEEFGTMEDWDRLRDACREKGIRIVMDLVVNHSSDEHPWFQESKSSRENSKSEYYIWRDPVDGHEPNNWASVFGGSAWEFVPERGQYYFHYFSKKQPDLNWACPQLREEIFRMMDWWVDKGVAGFRVDAISYLDKPQDFPDSAQPPLPDGYSFPDCLAGRPGTHAYIREMNRRIYAPRGVLTVGEVSAPTVEELGNYVRTGREEFDMAIPFVPPEVEIATWSPEKLKRDIQESYEALKEDGWWARFFSNHDKPRQVSLYGDDGQYWEVSAKFLAMFLHSLPGTPFVYQGEEIGMTDVRFSSIEDYNDLGTRNQYRQNLLAGMSPEDALVQAQRESRDNARTPMQWDGSTNGGFTTGTPWLKVNPNTKDINVEAQRQDACSVYQCYRRLIALRKSSPALTRGEMTFLETGCKELIAFTRSTPEETLLMFHNFSRQEHAIPEELLKGAGEALMSSYDREGGYQGPALRAYESVIFRMKK